MNSLNEMEQSFISMNQQVESMIREILEFRKNNPQWKMQSTKVIENELITFGRMVKTLSKEYQDDLMQGVSLLKIKMMC